MYDVQINSRYNNVDEEDDLPVGDYELVTEFWQKKELRQMQTVLLVFTFQIAKIS